MARKKPEAMQALDALRPSCECGATAIMWREDKNWCEPCYGLYRGEQARASMGELNLDRLPGEPIEVWRKRVLNWLRENATVKTFGRVA